MRYRRNDAAPGRSLSSLPSLENRAIIVPRTQCQESPRCFNSSSRRTFGLGATAAAAAPSSSSSTRSSSSSSSLLVLWAFLLTWCCGGVTVADASIRLQDANGKTNNSKKYGSALDSRGKQLWKGYDYFARLQHIPGELCLNGEDVNKTIVPSTDHLPIALIVKSGGGCTLEENIQYIAHHVVPQGYVNFLIVDTPAMSSSSADGTRASSAPAAAVALETPTVWGTVAATLFGSSTSSSSSLGGGVAKSPHHKNRRGDHDADTEPLFPFFILHVTFDAEFDLLDAVYHQDDETRQSGGPRITVDAKSASSPYWIAISAVLAACVCSFCIIFQSWLEVEQADQAPVPPRPNHHQRRLTRQQVRQMLPTYRYDGDRLHGMGGNDDDPAAATSGSAPPPPPADVIMDCCSICLDDYESGDILRVLACNHVYHAKCIGKWLVERSAVCPLCKEDLFVEEEEEEEEDDDEVQVVGPGQSRSEESVWRRIYQGLMVTADQDGEDDRQHAPLAAGAGEQQPAVRAASTTGQQQQQQQQQQQVTVNSSSERQPPWWSRMLYGRRQPPHVESSDLAEPLLEAAAAAASMSATENDPEAIVDNADNGSGDDDQQEMTFRRQDIFAASAADAAAPEASTVDESGVSNEHPDASTGNDAEAVSPTTSAQVEETLV